MSLLLVAALLTQPAQQAHSKVIVVPAREVLHQARTAPEASPGLQEVTAYRQRRLCGNTGWGPALD